MTGPAARLLVALAARPRRIPHADSAAAWLIRAGLAARPSRRGDALRLTVAGELRADALGLLPVPTWARVARLRSERRSGREIAAALGMTERRVWQVLAEARAAGAAWAAR